MSSPVPAVLSAGGVYQIGDIVPWHFEAHTIVSSFFSSLTGTVLTVELLHHRQLGKSFAARFQLLLCAMAMGLVGIWCMHYVGNSAIVLGNGERDLQIAYSAGFTILSSVLPVIGLSAAFYLAEVPLRRMVFRVLRHFACGILAGLSVVAMHYCGNLGITNYKLKYSMNYLGGAILIAIGDCTIALTLFFHFKHRWIGHWIKRLICAMILALAVCGMHYTASKGCQYELKALDNDFARRMVALWISTSACLLAATLCIGYMAYTGVRRNRLRRRAQQVGIACAYFDRDGNILVTHEGILPGQKIAERFNPESFDDDFSVAHPVFHWLWKVTHDWTSVSDLIPRMRTHLRSVRSEANDDFLPAADVDQSTLFRESFCVAAADLAERMRIQLDGLGVLYDRVIGTGITPSRRANRSLESFEVASLASSIGSEKGHVLFFIRTLSNREVDHFSALGYRFAPPSRIGVMLAKVLGIPPQFVTEHMRSLQAYARIVKTGCVNHTGTYLTCFAALGRLSRGFDVLASKTDQSQLPRVQLSTIILTRMQVEFLRQYDLRAVGDVVADLSLKQQQDHLMDAGERSLIIKLLAALWELSREMAEPWFSDLTFNAQPITSHFGRGYRETAMTIGLTKMLDIHSAAIGQPDRFTFVPLSFFRVRATIDTGFFDLAKFRTSVHTNFAVHLSMYDDEQAEAQVQRPIAAFFRGSTRFRTSSSTGAIPNSAPAIQLMTLPSPALGGSRLSVAARADWGGILSTTSTEVTNRQESMPRTDGDGFTSATGGTSSTAVPGRQCTETKTYVDSLYEQARRGGVALVSTTVP